MTRVISFLSLLCFLLFAGQASALESGAGSYVMHDGETGKNVTIWYFKPATFTPATPVLFVLHGLNRDAEDYRDQWKTHAEKHNLMLLVPCFSEELFPGTNGYNMGNIFSAKTKEEREGLANSGFINPRSLWSYRLLDKAFADFKANREKTRSAKYYLFGHSAGAQYVHRLIEFVPEAKIKLAIAANAGWYTLPDLDKEWPYGLKGTGLRQADAKRFLAFPLTVLLGEKDNDPKHRSLRHTPEADEQGDNRLARGKFFFAYGEGLAKKLKTPFGWKLQTVPGVAHSNEGMSAAAAEIIVKDAVRQAPRMYRGKTKK